MFERLRSSLQFLAAFGAVAALCAPALADHDHGYDLILNVDGGRVVIQPLDPDEDVEELFNRYMIPNPGYPDFPTGFPAAQFVDDTGFDVFPGIDVDPPYDTDGLPGYDYPISRARIQQVGISDGLFALYQYDGATPVFGNGPDFLGHWYLSDTQLDPRQIAVGGIDLYFHQHFDFFATEPGVYTFDFRLTDIVLRDGTSLPDSDVYRITYYAVAAVPEPGVVALWIGALVPGASLIRRYYRR
ncbi:MAG: hypothetical protein RMJ43_00820 [Chloroherpetonaceae bacterium]|nr:hypothetical protein [Chthonomonadaceae bacterium]MDW8206351.1 hypothetical protein [Chloroherpetonaceae bacterium]